MNFRKSFTSAIFIILTSFNIYCQKKPVVPLQSIALTFDDGPDSIYTPKILDILKNKKVKASFFLLGYHIKKYPKVTERINAEGHFVGNHTYSHLSIKESNIDVVMKEIELTEHLIDSLLGKSNKSLRPPFGSISEEQRVKLKTQGFTVVGWDIDTHDWETNCISVNEILQYVLTYLGPNKIIVLHCADYADKDSREKTVAALPVIIDELRKRNYKFVTLDKLPAFSKNLH